MVASGLLFQFWLLFTICGAFQFRTLLEGAAGEAAAPDVRIFYCVVLRLLESFISIGIRQQRLQICDLHDILPNLAYYVHSQLLC
jgi:hypothetical protein